MPNGNRNNTRRNKQNASNRATRVRALTMGQALPQTRKPLTGEEIIQQAQEQLRKSVYENTEFVNGNNWAPQSIKNFRAGLPEHDIISRMQNRMAAEIAQAEATGRQEVNFRFPLSLGKKLLQAITFLLSILTLPARFLAHLFGMLKAKVSPPAPGIAPMNWGRTRSMIEEGRFGSRANQILNSV